MDKYTMQKLENIPKDQKPGPFLKFPYKCAGKGMCAP